MSSGPGSICTSNRCGWRACSPSAKERGAGMPCDGADSSAASTALRRATRPRGGALVLVEWVLSAGWTCGLDHLWLTGGEATLHRHFAQIVPRACEEGE